MERKERFSSALLLASSRAEKRPAPSPKASGPKEKSRPCLRSLRDSASSREQQQSTTTMKKKRSSSSRGLSKAMPGRRGDR